MQKNWTLKTEIPNQKILKVRSGTKGHLINQCAYKQRIAPKYVVMYLKVCDYVTVLTAVFFMNEPTHSLGKHLISAF